MLLTVTGPVPKWATSTHRDYLTHPSAAEFQQFMTAVGRHYASQVAFYSIWNEANHPAFLRPQFNANGTPASPAGVQPAPGQPPRAAPETLLLVEDDAIIRLMFRRILGDDGFFILEAAGSLEALAIAEQFHEPIHLLVSEATPFHKRPQPYGRGERPA